MVSVPYTVFMCVMDPYALCKGNFEGRYPPNYHLYSYNLLKQYDRLDNAFLGSSVVNYFDIEQMYGKGNIFSMGIESSTIKEQIAYGKVLASKKPKEIVYFLSFYSFNPSRNPEPYFNTMAVGLNCFVVDFVSQYYKGNAYLDALKMYKHPIGSEWVQQFYSNGTRTQYNYLKDTNYCFSKTLADYLTLNYADVRLYGSKTFKDPKSVNASIEMIKEFKTYLSEKGIKLTLAFAPDHRLTTAMIYRMGLGKTFEHLRRKLSNIQPFHELNADVNFTSDSLQYWDAHHVRNGKQVVENIRSAKYLVNKANVDSVLNTMRPTQFEMDKVVMLFLNYKDWKTVKERAEKDKELNPPVVP